MASPEGSNVITRQEVEEALSDWYCPVPWYSRLIFENRKLVYIHEVDPGVERSSAYTSKLQEIIEARFQRIRADIKVKVAFVMELDAERPFAPTNANSVYSVELISDHVIDFRG